MNKVYNRIESITGSTKRAAESAATKQKHCAKAVNKDE